MQKEVLHKRSTQTKMSVDLYAGELVIESPMGESRVNELLSFASRYNNKRQYMFASNVLGKYIPARPSSMIEAQKALLSLVPFRNETTTFIGFAESACGLGEALFHQAIEDNLFLKPKAAFTHTTRQFKGTDNIALHFIEPHSHAADQVLMKPKDRDVRAIVEHSTTLVLIEDEITTGNTMTNFIRIYLKKYPNVRRIEVMTYVDWRTNAQKVALCEQFPHIQIQTYALLTGNINFNVQRDNLLVSKKPPLVPTPFDDKTIAACARYGILSTKQPCDKAAKRIERLSNHFLKNITVVGTSEFTYWAQQIASTVESMGADVNVIATTRAPLQVRDDIHSKLEFISHYGDGQYHYLYNLPTDGLIFFCYETHEQAQQHAELLHSLRAIALVLEDE